MFNKKANEIKRLEKEVKRITEINTDLRSQRVGAITELKTTQKQLQIANSALVQLKSEIPNIQKRERWVLCEGINSEFEGFKGQLTKAKAIALVLSELNSNE